DHGIADALEARDADRSQNSKDNHDSGSGVRRQAPLAHECTYPDFMKCKPLYFKGTEGVVELTQWFERMETVFCISNYIVENQIKFATCTLFGSALTWMFPEESDKIERYVGGLPDMIHGSVMASKPKTVQDAVEFATELMDKKIRTLLNVRLRIKGSKMITNKKKTKGRTLAGPTLLGMWRRIHMGDLSHCVLKATITMMVRVLLNATSATELAIWP
nr:hypothetical protein [Tanacetum cinerariifolium]